MPEFPQDWGALCWLAWMLGVKHGLDADHVAAIDGLTRTHTAAGRRFALLCGALFSLGHGIVILTVAVLVVHLGHAASVPTWLEPIGAAFSFALLVVIAIQNLHAVLTTGPGMRVAVAGLRSRHLAGFFQAKTPVAVALVGAVFALSFETVTQAGLFAIAGVHAGGPLRALGLASLFAGGMLLADSACGWWIGRLLSRADALAAVASRVMGIAVALLSLTVAGVAAAAWLAPRAFRALPQGVMTGVTVLGLSALAYLFAEGLVRLRSDRRTSRVS